MKTKTNTLRGALVRSALAVALAFGMVPAQAFANTSDGADAPASAQQAADRPEITTDTVDMNAGESSSQAGAADGGSQSGAVDSAAQNGEGNAATANDNGESAAAGQSQTQQTAQIPVNSASAVDRSDILNTSVQLAGGEDAQAAATTIAYNGLLYTVNADAPETVTLTGWTGTAPKGAVNVPAQITSGTATYQVTNVRTPMNLGGGVSANCGS